MNFVKAQLEKAERFVENVEQKVAERVVPGLNNNNDSDDDEEEEYSDSEWGEDGSIRRQRRRRPKVVLSDDSDNEEEGKEEVAFEEKKKTTKSAFKVEDVASGYDANDRSAETTSAAFLTENAATTIQTTTHSSPSKQLLGKPPSPPISVAKQQLAEQREREREDCLVQE